MDFALDSGKIQRTLAWGRTQRPDAVSSTYTIVADSLDILMPAQVVRDVWAFRGARATTRPDTTVTEDDWMTGDTLHAVFLPPDTARAGSLARRDSGAARDSGATRKQRLERLLSFGRARALYHVTDDAKPGERPGVNYNRGSRIAIRMREGKVHTVDVVGQVDGVYLEPFTRRTRRRFGGCARPSAGRHDRHASPAVVQRFGGGPAAPSAADAPVTAPDLLAHLRSRDPSLCLAVAGLLRTADETGAATVRRARRRVPRRLPRGAAARGG